MRFCYKTTLICILALLTGIQPVLGGTTGKIVGQITELESGEVLAGAQVRIEGTSLGTLTDNEGHFFILDVAPGVYSVTASLIGHQEVTKSQVEVFVDGTTRLDFQLATRVLEMPTMTITAERPLLRKDVTSSIKVVSDQKIRTLPINRLEDVLKIQPGFVVDENNELHIRGGRSGEVAYFIDGIPVENSLFGGINSLLNDDAIDQLLILTGTFNAEYGDALSAVVNVITKEGEDDFHGQVEYKSAMINDSPYRKADWAGEGIDSQRDPVTNGSLYTTPDIFDRDIRLPIPGSFSASFSGPVRGVNGLSFYLGTRSNKENSHLPFGYHLEEDLNWKLSYKIGKGKKLTLLGQNSQNDFQRYSHAWKYRSDHRASNLRTSDRFGVKWNQSVGDNTFLTILGSRDRQYSDVSVGDKIPADYVQNRTEESLNFYVEGDDDLFRRSQITTTLGKADLIQQRGERHEIKTGGEFKLHDINLLEFSEPWLDLEESYSTKPIEGAIYFQDKIEYDFFVLNTGLRFDFIDPRARMWSDPENPESPLVDVSVKSQLSPRIGLSHPITDRSIIYFSYGHFFQNPEYSLFFSDTRNLDPSNLSELTFGSVGNRDIKPKKTVAYEVGVKQELTEDLGLGVTAFFKDINNMIGMEEVRITTENNSYWYTYFTNIDYANVKGFEVTLDRRYSNHLAWDLNYTYSIAKGNHSFPREVFFNVYFEREEENQDFFLDFDRRHVISSDITLNAEDWEGPRFLGFHPLANTGLSAIIQYSSGLSYTPTLEQVEVQPEKNSARLPWTGTVDLNLYKDILSGSFKQSLFLEITNLFDRQNVLRVNSFTGNLWETSEGTAAGSEAIDSAFDPSDVGPPRIIRIGMRTSF
jgi:outer membrane receptor for ferrienterochelin and colicin